MCFVEYLGYQCGHNSIGVNRTCPLTTFQHTNPCCSIPATRPFLASTMCYPCSRIIHGRRVDIAEYEHRWMHERGACGCDVKFPAMQGPRFVQRTSTTTGGYYTETAPGVGTSTAGPAFYGRGGVPSMGNTGRNSQPTQYGGGTSLPLFQENYVDGHVEVSVRLPSLYAAEWTKDHAELHETGRCKCPVSFERYQPYDVENDQDEGNGPTPDSTHHMRSSSGDDRAAPAGHVARWALNGPPGYLTDSILGPVRPDASTYGGRPVDIQTVHYPGTNNSLPVADNLVACGSTEQTEPPSIVEFQQPQVTIAGFPIGAGPEGESHAGDWENCSLNFRNSPVRRRRLSSEF
ncbi:hypothetical protein F5Y14DRAFT_438442 [Nemania sp. NC0429]|nr:hypothetical protein F5Y14DRAFT_438442 [Nemania sp. NC0429]